MPRSPLPKKTGDASPAAGTTAFDPFPFADDQATPSSVAGVKAPSGGSATVAAAASGITRSTTPAIGTTSFSPPTVSLPVAFSSNSIRPVSR